MLGWLPPENTGNCRTQSYIIVMRENEGEKFKKIGKVDAKSLSYKVGACYCSNIKLIFK